MKTQHISLVAALVLVSFLTACAEFKDAGRTIGHTTKDVTTAVGHASRDAAKSIGETTKEVVSDIKEGSED